MTEAVEDLEQRITRIRTAVREAVLAGDRERANTLRRDLRQAEQDWEDALAAAENVRADADAESAEGAWARRAAPRAGTSPSLLPLREQVHEAFFAGTFPTVRLTSMKRDEERSFRTAPFARPYYICAALTTD